MNEYDFARYATNIEEICSALTSLRRLIRLRKQLTRFDIKVDYVLTYQTDFPITDETEFGIDDTYKGKSLIYHVNFYIER